MFRSWIAVGALALTSCNSLVSDKSAMSDNAETAATSFKSSLSRAFSESASTELMQSQDIASGVAGDYAKSMVMIACNSSDDAGSALMMADMSAEERQICAIWGMSSRSIEKSAQNAVIGANIEGDISISSMWEGQAKNKGRILPAILLEARFNIVNPAEGFRGPTCIRKFSIIDKEFNVERSIMFRSCAQSDAGKIGEAMAQEGVVDIPAAYKATLASDTESPNIGNETSDINADAAVNEALSEAQQQSAE